MPGLSASAPAARNDHAACSGCSLCLLVCPVWRRTHDLRMTPHGRAKALQHGASVTDIAASVGSCTLCGACEPVCPEEIDLVGMTIGLRRELRRLDMPEYVQARTREPAALWIGPRRSSRSVLLPNQALRDHSGALARVAALLGDSQNIDIAGDDGADIALALEAGAAVAQQRLEQFLAPLRSLKQIIVADGLLLRELRKELPRTRIASLGEALSSNSAVRRGLRASDLYVIEPRAYHADYRRLVKYYDRLRTSCGCAFNLDLQRIAIPATARSLPQRLGREAPDDDAQTRWLLQGRAISRIVVESLEDAAAFERVSETPVVHLADLADDGLL